MFFFYNELIILNFTHKWYISAHGYIIFNNFFFCFAEKLKFTSSLNFYVFIAAQFNIDVKVDTFMTMTFCVFFSCWKMKIINKACTCTLSWCLALIYLWSSSSVWLYASDVLSFFIDIVSIFKWLYVGPMFCHFYFVLMSQLKMNFFRTDVKSYFMLLRLR
jgi:hypothetical protein